MSTRGKGAVKRIGWIFLGMAAAVILLLAVLTVTEYKPKETESAETGGTALRELSIGDRFSVVTWNIGYAGLGATADFFMDGGTHVRSDKKEEITENISAISERLRELSADIIYLQETDRASKRSYYVDELDYVSEKLPEYAFAYAPNYRVLYVPYPLPTIGKVECGLATLSAYAFTDSQRIALPCPFSYPIRTCNLKRCLLVNRVPIQGSEKELVLVNLHLEAYDDGAGKEAQTKQLRNLLFEEAEKGNYVIAGGDFNQSFSNYDNSAYPIIDETMWVPGELSADDFTDAFLVVTDNTTPSCRTLDRPLAGNEKAADTFQYYMIDGFLVSDNLKIHAIETKDFGFENSDHNPILMEISFENTSK